MRLITRLGVAASALLLVIPATVGDGGPAGGQTAQQAAGLTRAGLTAAGTSVGAAAAASDASGLVYPVTSFLDWAKSPLANVTDPALGVYALQQTVAQAQAAVLKEFPSELNISSLLGPQGPAAAEDFSEAMAAQLIHLRPQTAGDDVTDMADPQFLPDYDHNGVSGDPGDFVAMEDGNGGTGYFLYPCISDTGAVTYETTAGVCAPAGTAGDTYKEGMAQRESIVDSRGLTLSATMWLPAAALRPGCPGVSADPSPCAAPQGLAPRASLDGGRGLPVVVIAEGIASSQDSYFWLAMTLARAGDIVVTYDPAGQGGSQGSVADLFTPSVANCEFAGACRDLEDVTRWVVGDAIAPVVDLATATPLVAVAGHGSSGAGAKAEAADRTGASPYIGIHDPAYAPVGSNVIDPALDAVDPGKVGIVGHSMGALSLLNYLWFQGQGTTGADGRPLPAITTGIALSGAAKTAAVVPVQFQTSDFDGSPTLIGPAVAGVNLGAAGSGIGYQEMKPLYDQLRTSGPGRGALSMIVLEGGVHTDFIDTPFIPRTPWSLAVSAHYATSWLDCFLDDDPVSCLTAVVPVHHLSSAFASEATPGGPAPRSSLCLTVPTHGSLDDTPTELLPALAGHPPSTCLP